MTACLFVHGQTDTVFVQLPIDDFRELYIKASSTDSLWRLVEQHDRNIIFYEQLIDGKDSVINSLETQVKDFRSLSSSQVKTIEQCDINLNIERRKNKSIKTAILGVSIVSFAAGVLVGVL